MKRPVAVTLAAAAVTVAALAGCTSSAQHTASPGASGTATAAAQDYSRALCSEQAAWNQRGQASVRALYADTGVPTDASRWGLGGARIFLDWAEDLRDARVLTADLLGVLLTRVESGTRITREIRADLQASGLPLFGAEIPKRTAAERMVGNRLVVGDEGTDADINDAYVALTLECIARINEVRGKCGRHGKG